MYGYQLAIVIFAAMTFVVALVKLMVYIVSVFYRNNRNLLTQVK